MIILRNKEFSDSNKEEKKTNKEALVAGLASLGVGGYNSGKLYGAYRDIRDSSKDIVKKNSKYKTIKANNEKMAREFKDAADRAKKARERVSKGPLKLKDKIKIDLNLRKIERQANKRANSLFKATDKMVNDMARKDGLKHIVGHNKKNIAGALAGTIAGAALISKSVKNKKKKDDNTKTEGI